MSLEVITFFNSSLSKVGYLIVQSVGVAIYIPQCDPLGTFSYDSHFRHHSPLFERDLGKHVFFLEL